MFIVLRGTTFIIDFDGSKDFPSKYYLTDTLMWLHWDREGVGKQVPCLLRRSQNVNVMYNS